MVQQRNIANLIFGACKGKQINPIAILFFLNEIVVITKELTVNQILILMEQDGGSGGTDIFQRDGYRTNSSTDSSTVVSASSFVNLSSPVFNLNEDGTYDVAIKTTVDVDMAAGDSLTLKAEIGETYNKTAALSDGKQTLNLTIQNVPAELLEEEVTLSISGEQTASGVFLFDAYGNRESSQSMIGMDNSRGPVYAEVTATQARILNFTKTTNSGLPLEGISFDLFYVASMKDYLSGKIDLPEPEDCPHDALAEYTVITDSAGKATMNFTQHGLSDGIYLVVERQHPAIVAPIKPFYVFMPATNAQGTGYTYEISVHPKNEVKGNVKIEKDVTSIGNNDS